MVYTTPPGLIAFGDRLPRTALRLYGVTHILPHTGQIAGFIIVCIIYFSYIEHTLIYIIGLNNRAKDSFNF